MENPFLTADMTLAERKSKLKVFEKLSVLTPDFDGQDLFDLFERAIQGDPTSQEMMVSLYKRKINPYLRPEFQVSFDREEN